LGPKIEELRDQVAGAQGEQQRFLEERMDPYQGMVELLVRDEDFSGALAWSEGAKTRTLLDTLLSGRVDLTKEMTDEEKAAEQRIKSKLISLNAERAYLFLVSKQSASQKVPDLRVYTLSANSDELRDIVERFRESLGHRDLQYNAMARRLYDVLIRPAESQLQDKTRRVIVPDGALWDLPFQALQSASNHFLIEDYAISSAPSLTALREMTRIRTARSADDGRKTTLLAMGNPLIGKETSSTIQAVFMDEKLLPLPQAERQVETLGRLYGPSHSKVYVGAEATEDRLKAEAGNCRILHIATHGIVNDASPMYSQLVLSRGKDSADDGILEAWEIMNLNLKADLVVLSACETARGRVSAGEGMIGLSWAVFVAGCPSTVVSQWKVEDQSTVDLMVEFHRNLISGMGKAEALRRAELKLLKGGGEHAQHPFYWAGFVLIGDAN
jgi:CHAT domain-containing protein